MSILEQFRGHSAFTPTNLNEFFALQLARRLNDVSNAEWYVPLCEQFGTDHLLSVYRSEIAAGEVNLAERFKLHFH
jgi:hypothetical protein